MEAIRGLIRERNIRGPDLNPRTMSNPLPNFEKQFIIIESGLPSHNVFVMIMQANKVVNSVVALPDKPTPIDINAFELEETYHKEVMLD